MHSEFFRNLGINPKGNLRADRVAHNGGYYDAYGHKIGWGDLDAADIEKLKRNLPPGVPLFILGEQDSFWRHVVHNPGPTGDYALTTGKEQHPGTRYVIEHARYLILDGEAYICDRSPRDADKVGRHQFKDVSFKVLPREHIWALIQVYLN